jgi:hypothetical protein
MRAVVPRLLRVLRTLWDVHAIEGWVEVERQRWTAPFYAKPLKPQSEYDGCHRADGPE